MRLTEVLFHRGNTPILWWGKGWGERPQKWNYPYKFRRWWGLNCRRKIVEYEQTLPEGVVVEEANQYVKRCMHAECKVVHEKAKEKLLLPWPYSERPIKYTPSDPDYRPREALLFNRYRRLVDPINQSLVYTNTVCESISQLPECVTRLFVETFDEQFLSAVKNRLKWCTTSDGILRKLPLNRVFPYLDQTPPRVFGIPRNRKEKNYLKTLFELSQSYIAQHYGFIESRKVAYPYCALDFERDGRLVVFDLECDFITLTKQSDSLPLFSTSPLLTIDKPLASIHPLRWTTAFEETNFYPIDYDFKISPQNNVQTIYLAHNALRDLDMEYHIGRAIFYCYGYAVAYARSVYGSDCNDKELPDPIPIQCVFINPKDFNLGFVCFQLNTTSFDSPLKNQVWIDSAYTERTDVMRRVIALQLNGYVDAITKKVKNSISFAN